MQLFRDALSHNGERCDVCFIKVNRFDGVPKETIIKAHAVCFFERKMLLVHHPQWDIWGIPGGTLEPNESAEATLVREIQEETNCEILDITPIGYQEVISPNGEVHYRTQYMCNVRPLGEFLSDPAGNIDGIKWIDPEEFRDHIEKKEFKQAVIQRALDILREREERN
jgi:ADP-ribose pyrophosphatase YjhB (NUDIX family)